MELKVIAFDADDTLWDNEIFYHETEKRFHQLLESHMPAEQVAQELLQTEIKNIERYGYGIKAFMLSMIETAIRVTDKSVSITVIEEILAFGHDMLEKPIQKLDGVDEVLEVLKSRYRLVVATKGDLLDQERKLRKSGLSHYFHHTEIMSEKREADYEKLIRHLDIQPGEFMMIGNSIKSDILPVLNIGGHGRHIPYHITWGHEVVESKIEHSNFRELTHLRELLDHV
jgi:putative hydrolase of the HAD superfamily